MNPNENVMHAIVAAIQTALGVDDGGFAAQYFDDGTWDALSIALRDNDHKLAGTILDSYARAERSYRGQA